MTGVMTAAGCMLLVLVKGGMTAPLVIFVRTSGRGLGTPMTPLTPSQPYRSWNLGLEGSAWTLLRVSVLLLPLSLILRLFCCNQP